MRTASAQLGFDQLDKKKRRVSENMKNRRFSPAFAFTHVGCIGVALLYVCSTPYKDGESLRLWGLPWVL